LATGVDLSAYWIKIEASPTNFIISDNCGGMTLDDAVAHAFSFGRQESDQLDDYSIGVYGIGMKRAIFKLGNTIKIRSTFSERDDRTSFEVPIDVAAWMESDTPPWDFDILPSPPLGEDGVRIEVSDLTGGASSAFANPAFLQDLRRTLARDYSLHLANGLQIYVNGELVEGWAIELREGADFQPLRISYEDEVDGEPVLVEILGGMAAPPPDNNEPSEEGRIGRRSGWYVVCNGRVVLAADKSTISGWGTDDWPQWHGQYDGFLGIVLFSSKKAIALPMTTTKRSVDVTSEVYKRARPRMRDISKRWISYTNQRKQSLEEAKLLEARATPVAIQQVTPNEAVRLPNLGVQAQPAERVANVAYSVPLRKMRALAAEFGSINLSYREVGLRSFQYAFDDLVGEE
jgi:hypothetical protein